MIVIHVGIDGYSRTIIDANDNNRSVECLFLQATETC